MKKLILVSFCIMLLAACKKTEFSPEGPTDVRIRNLSDQNFSNIIISTSEYEEDKDTIDVINAGEVSDYHRFKKAYSLAEISAKIEVDGSPVTFTTGPVSYTYLTYLSTMKVTLEVYISNMSARTLKISDVVPEEELVLK